MELQMEASFFVWDAVLACSSLNYFTVQLYIEWRQPGISFVYQTIIWLKKVMEEEMVMNCYVLTTRNEGPWEFHNPKKFGDPLRPRVTYDFCRVEMWNISTPFDGGMSDTMSPKVRKIYKKQIGSSLSNPQTGFKG